MSAPTRPAAGRSDTTPSLGPFAIAIDVRVYELDTQGHLNSAVYLQYAEHARWQHLALHGITVERLIASGVGPVFLESTIRWHHEVRAGDTVSVGVRYDWPEHTSKTFLIHQEFRLANGNLAAQLTSCCGLLDLDRRRLVPDPRARLDALAAKSVTDGGPT